MKTQSKSELLAKRFDLASYDCTDALSRLTSKLRNNEYELYLARKREGFKAPLYKTTNNLLKEFYASFLGSTQQFKTKAQWLEENDRYIAEGEVALPFWSCNKEGDFGVYKMYNRSQTLGKAENEFFDDYNKEEEYDKHEYETWEQ